MTSQAPPQTPVSEGGTPASATSSQFSALGGGKALWLASTIGALWAVFAVAEGLLWWWMPTSSLHEAQLPWLARVSLLAFDLAVLGPWIVAIVPPVALAASWIAKRSDVPVWIRGFGFSAAVLVLGGFLLLYGVSWGAFWSAGSFLTGDAFEFWATQPVQIFHWAPPGLFYGLPVTAFAAAVGIGILLPVWLHRWPKTALLRLSATTGVLFLLCLVVRYTGARTVHASRERVNDPLIGVPFTVGQLYDQLQLERSGVFAHAWKSQFGSQSPWKPPVPRNEAVQTAKRSILSLEEYLVQVDRSVFKPMNVIVILVESLRPDQLAIYEGRRLVMPTVDAMARQSQVFQEAYTQASHSNYADLGPLSSHYPLRSHRTHVYPKNPTYPRVLIYDVLKALGYRVGFFSSQNEHWGKMINYLDTGNIDRLMHAATWDGPTYVSPTDTGFAHWVTATQHAGSVDDRFTVREAIAWIQSLRGAPFFIYMNLQNSHFPYVVPEGFKRPFGPAHVRFAMAFNNYPRREIPVVKALYADSLYYIDQQLKRLFDALKRFDQWNNTIVVLTGDTGQAFFEHGFACHANALYNEVMKVPLVIWAPGREHQIHPGPAQHIDVPPTVFHLLGLPPHPAWQGRNLLDSHAPVHPSIFLVVHTPLAHQYAIVRDDHKLIYDARHDYEVIYDLERDPGETVDISRGKPGLREALSERLHAWRYYQIKYYADPFAQKRWYPPVLIDD